MNEQLKDNLYYKLIFLVLCGIAASIVFSLLLVNSLFIIALLLLWILKGSFRQKWDLLSRDTLFKAYLLLFVANAIGILYTPDWLAGWKNTESQLGFVVLPLIFCSSPLLSARTRTGVLMVYSIVLTVAALGCLAIAAWKYGTNHNPAVFFYHDLVSPLDHHAVYFSVYIFITLSFLLFEGYALPRVAKNKWIYITWILFLLGFVVLLSSKMALVVLLLFFAWFVIRRYAVKHTKKLFIIAVLAGATIAAVLIVDNPVKRRFSDMADMDMSFLKKETFSPNDYFNGLKFRLLLWRFTYEILQEKDAWWLGVSPAEGQHALRQKYTSMNMYLGDKEKNDPGYLDYNCHNQLLQTTLQSGIVGLIAFLIWCVALAMQAFRKKNILLTSLVFLLFCFFLTDSVFERQYGMILCTFFPLLLLYSEVPTHTPSPPSKTGNGTS